MGRCGAESGGIEDFAWMWVYGGRRLGGGGMGGDLGGDESDVGGCGIRGSDVVWGRGSHVRITE